MRRRDFLKTLAVACGAAAIGVTSAHVAKAEAAEAARLTHVYDGMAIKSLLHRRFFSDHRKRPMSIELSADAYDRLVGFAFGPMWVGVPGPVHFYGVRISRDRSLPEHDVVEGVVFSAQANYKLPNIVDYERRISVTDCSISTLQKFTREDLYSLYADVSSPASTLLES